MIKKIGIVADTHDNLPKIKEIIQFFNKEKVDFVLHAGDIIAPFAAAEFEKLNCDFLAVFGNNDGDRAELKHLLKFKINDPPYFIKAHGMKILLLHKADEILEVLEKSGNYDCIIYGHTHKQDIRITGNTIIINPGEGCGYLT